MRRKVTLLLLCLFCAAPAWAYVDPGGLGQGPFQYLLSAALAAVFYFRRGLGRLGAVLRGFLGRDAGVKK